MPVWQKADEIVGEIYKLTEMLPKGKIMLYAVNWEMRP